MSTNDWQQQLKIAGKDAKQRQEQRREEEQKAKEIDDAEPMDK